MTNQELVKKVRESFSATFGYDCKLVEIIVNICFTSGYTCKVNSRGVVKNSWRIDNDN